MFLLRSILRHMLRNQELRQQLDNHPTTKWGKRLHTFTDLTMFTVKATLAIALIYPWIFDAPTPANSTDSGTQTLTVIGDN